MPTFTVFDGARKRRATGRHQAAIASFAYDHPDFWHVARCGSSVRRAIHVLEHRGLLKTKRVRGHLLFRYVPSRVESGYSIQP